MLALPQALKEQFEALLKGKAIPQEKHSHYLKWLRLYLDFCHKYGFARAHSESIQHFIGKLRRKRQTEAQQKQASEAIAWFYGLLSASQSESTAVSSGIQREAPHVDEQNKRYETKASNAGSMPNPIGGDLASAMESGKSLQTN